MDAPDRVFISYRRDDAAGYAGRLEEALERRLGRGSVFRDVLDIAPGADFSEAIRQRLAGAQTVLVLIGPRWAGGDGTGPRRIDDAQDFVRLEVQMALDGGARVVTSGGGADSAPGGGCPPDACPYIACSASSTETRGRKPVSSSSRRVLREPRLRARPSSSSAEVTRLLPSTEVVPR